MGHTVTLNWNANVPAVDGYNVYHGTVKGQENTKLNSTLVTVTTFIDSTPTPGDNFYVVKAVLGALESAASIEVDAVLLPDAPTGLVAKVN